MGKKFAETGPIEGHSRRGQYSILTAGPVEEEEGEEEEEEEEE